MARIAALIASLALAAAGCHHPPRKASLTVTATSLAPPLTVSATLTLER